MFRCKVCGWLHAGDAPPDACPSCGSPPDRFRPTGASPAAAPSSAAPPRVERDGPGGDRLRLLALVPATIDSPFAIHGGPAVALVTGDDAWFDDNIPCLRACPVATDAATYIGHVAGGAFGLADAVNRHDNLFAGTLGRTCSRPCEDACRRTVIDAPVRIRALKRAAADRAAPAPGEPPPDRFDNAGASPAGQRRAVVVGGGVAGLTAAHDLADAGFAVTIMEREAGPGGLMRTGVPAWRLPRATVADDISRLLAAGIALRTGVELGRDVSVDDLSADFDVVVIATGAQRPVGLDADIPGGRTGDGDGVIDGLRFLRESASGASTLAGPVVVVGGGYTAFDCARTARRLGTGEVTVAMRGAADEPALREELAEALAEGVAVRDGVRVRRVERDGTGVAGVTLVTDEGATMSVPCRLIVTALGQRPDLGVIRGAARFVRERPAAAGVGGTEGVDAGPATDAHAGSRGDTEEMSGRHDARLGGWPNVWLTGDVLTGATTFIDAIASARRVVREIVGRGSNVATGPAIDRAGPEMASAKPNPIQPAAPAAPRDDLPDHTRTMLDRRIRGDDPYRETPPQPDRERPVAQRGLGSGDAAVEVSLGLDDAGALLEAGRCLQCQANIAIDGARCILCNGCVDVCPYGCISMLGLDRVASIDGRTPDAMGLAPLVVAMAIDEDACIRCGKCVDWCPTACLTMPAHRPAATGRAALAPVRFDLFARARAT